VSYAEHLAANRRLCILQNLIADQGHGSETAIEQTLRAQGHHASMSRDHVRELLKDLKALDAVTIDYFRDTLMVAHITERGVAVAEGRITVDGVEKPPIGRR
jgi:hypothetical protein